MRKASTTILFTFFLLLIGLFGTGEASGWESKDIIGIWDGKYYASHELGPNFIE